MEQESKFIHNFCESRLTNNTPPEIYNAYTSFNNNSFSITIWFSKKYSFL